MSSGVFVLDRDNKLHPLNERRPEQEDYLQELLAKHPKLMSGELIDPESPRQWILISRELPVGDSEQSGGRWAADHLFIDQDSIPTIVEVKRCVDTRIRREVIGQMLEYAANAVAYYPLEKLQALFEARCTRDGSAPDDALREAFGATLDCARFWNQVHTNLRAGRIRLILLADEIPSESRRIIEFLNEQMSETEILAIEIKQYGAPDELRTLIPRVYGHSQRAVQTKNPVTRRLWDKETVFADIDARFQGVEREVSRRVAAWAEELGLKLSFGTGRSYGSMSPWFPTDQGGTAKGTPLFVLYTIGHIEICFRNWHRAPFSDLSMRSELLRHLNEIPGIALPPDSIDRYPGIPFKKLNLETLEAVLAVFEWMVSELKKAATAGGKA